MVFLSFLIFKASEKLNYLKAKALFIYAYDWEKVSFLPGLHEKIFFVFLATVGFIFSGLAETSNNSSQMQKSLYLA